MHSSECQWASVDFAEEDSSISRWSVSLETVQEKRKCCNIKKQKQNLKKTKTAGSAPLPQNSGKERSGFGLEAK